MKFKALFFSALILLTSSVNATCCPNKKRCYREYLNAYFGTGYRRDEFNFNVAADDDGGVPDVARELGWQKVISLPFWGYVDYRHPCGFVAKVYGDSCRTYDGNATEKRWEGDGRTLLSVSNEGWGNRGYMWDAGCGLGYSIKVYGDLFIINPMIGFEANQQGFRMFDVHQRTGPHIGKINHQHHNITALWRGPWAGFESWSGPWLYTDLWLHFGYDFHYLYYRGSEHDSLPDLTTGIITTASRHQRAHGVGNHVWGALDYHCTRAWSIGLYASYANYHTFKGQQDSVITNSSPESVIINERHATLNRVNWRSYMLLLTLGYHY